MRLRTRADLYNAAGKLDDGGVIRGQEAVHSVPGWTALGQTGRH